MCGAGIWWLVGDNRRLAGWGFCSTPWNSAGRLMMIMMLFVACVRFWWVVALVVLLLMDASWLAGGLGGFV